ncbi:MAG: hypothetical protein AAGA08_16085 [Pseudomonadota bacterium]
MRKLITLVLMGLAFYGGLKIERFLNEGRCTNAGGTVNERGLCIGVNQ